MENQKKIILIGAGNLGSRHLQALKSVDLPLNITVIDPTDNSLIIAKKRYNSMKKGKFNHTINYLNKIDVMDEIVDLGIIATNSNVRKSVTEQLLEKNIVKNLILEKILFQNPEDYKKIKNLIEKSSCNTWVNCPRRLFPIYKHIKEEFKNKIVYFKISGSNFGLMSNLIHFIDIMSFILDCTDFIIDPSHLIKKFIPSKRKGYLELNGLIQVHFKNGSHGILHCIPSGNLPLIHEIYTDSKRYIIKETEGKAWYFDINNEPKWQEMESKFLFQSQLTSKVVEDLFKKKKCGLTPFNESMTLHLSTFNPILQFIKDTLNPNLKIYPFS